LVLRRGGTLAYTAESMRLTTRLMQLASWLMLQRAVNENEITREQARHDQNRVKVASLGASEPNPAFAELPEALRALVDRSLRLQTRIVHLDRLLDTTSEPANEEARSEVAVQIDRLAAAFGRK
jgi:regulator of CtrA degradation